MFQFEGILYEKEQSAKRFTLDSIMRESCMKRADSSHNQDEHKTITLWWKWTSTFVPNSIPIWEMISVTNWNMVSFLWIPSRLHTRNFAERQQRAYLSIQRWAALQRTREDFRGPRSSAPPTLLASGTGAALCKAVQNLDNRSPKKWMTSHWNFEFQFSQNLPGFARNPRKP